MLQTAHKDKKMADRSAHATIKGYFYQFDKTILELLDATSPDFSIVVEGIEDIDLTDGSAESLIQCKYYEGTEYVHSVIKDAVIHMLRHFGSLGCQAGQTLRYRVYGHYKSGQEKLPATLDLAFVKKHFFSYRENGVLHEVHNELGIDDSQIGHFLSLLDVDIRAPSYDIQQQRVRDLLANTLPGCNAEDAEAFHYPRAINAIQKLAVQATPVQRTITRADFISAVDQKDTVFSRWLLEKFGSDHYAKSLKRKHFAIPGTRTPKVNRIFSLDMSDGLDIARAVQMLRAIGTRFSNKEHRRTPDSDRFCPYVLLRGITEGETAVLKNALYESGAHVEDGHPFLGSAFYRERLHALPAKADLPRLRFIPSDLQLAPAFAGIHGSPTEVFDFYRTSPVENGLRIPGAIHNEIQVPHSYFISEILKP